MTFTNDGLAVPRELGTHSVAKVSSDIHTDHSKGDMVGITSDEGTTTKNVVSVNCSVASIVPGNVIVATIMGTG